jgi:CheY-like chemotaxis protein
VPRPTYDPELAARSVRELAAATDEALRADVQTAVRDFFDASRRMPHAAEVARAREVWPRLPTTLRCGRRRLLSVTVDATNGLDGLRLARSHPFDLIICDLRMPGIDGFTVIAALHDDPATRNIPVLVLTAQDLTQADRNRLAGKTLAVISKGDATPAELHNWMQRITELTHLTR